MFYCIETVGKISVSHDTLKNTVYDVGDRLEKATNVLHE